jgi:hypothetical protein
MSDADATRSQDPGATRPSTDQGEWISRLELLHARYRDRRSGRGSLSPDELDWYHGARRMFFATAVAMQNATLFGEERLRAAIRVERAVPVHVRGSGWDFSAGTVDLGVGGFAALAAPGPRLGDAGVSRLELYQGEHLESAVRVVASVVQGDLARISFAFEEPSPALRERIEDYLLDQLLPRLVFWDEVLGRVWS